MLVLATTQGKREFCIAIRNRELHKNSCCPGNYSVDYRHGWFYVQYGCNDEYREQLPHLTKEADEMMEGHTHHVGYQSGFNTYVLLDGPHPGSEEYQLQLDEVNLYH